jgi:hypothetical protein
VNDTAASEKIEPAATKGCDELGVSSEPGKGDEGRETHQEVDSAATVVGELLQT